MSQSTVKVRCGKFANLPPASSPSSNPSLDPRLDQPDISCHFTFSLVPTTTPPSDRAIEKVRDLHLAGACIRVSNCDIHFICFAFFKRLFKISFAQRRQKKMVFQLQAHGTRSFGFFYYFYSARYSRKWRWGNFLSVHSCVVMICPTQTAMFLRAFFLRVNALLSRLKELGCAWD